MTISYNAVFRTKPLPVQKINGQFFIVSTIIAETKKILEQIASAGFEDGGHEGLVFWAGRNLGDLTILTTVIAPKTKNTSQSVLIDEKSFGLSARAARKHGLGILCQVHSHPGKDTRHSDGDDGLIVMPFENMLSIVVPSYGNGFDNFFNASVHQYQSGIWVLCDSSSVENNIKIVPTCVDIR